MRTQTMPNRTISNSDDVIDSRDVIARIEELQGIIQDAQDELREEQGAADEDEETGEETDTATCGVCGLSWNDAAVSSVTPAPSGRCPFESTHEEAEELAVLVALAEEAEGYAADWKYGGALIRDSYFRDYAEELARDCYDMKQAEGWPFRHIDWDAAAEELKQDYTAVDFDGVTYWIR